MAEASTHTADEAPADGDSNASGKAPKKSSRMARDLVTVPNAMSISRIFFIVGAVVLFEVGHPLIGLSLGIWCGVSDYLDGWIARRTGQVTEIGDILDRLGDLVFEVVAFVFALSVGILAPYLFLLYMFREIVVMSARQYVSEHRDRGIVIKTSIFGKLKTNMLGYTFLCVFFLHADVSQWWELDWFLDTSSQIMVHLAILFSYISGLKYIHAFVRTYDAAEE
jgi:CDP-diacylglycerol--glycerol-3-phosphate 3-phosphatidyltransferase